MTQTSPPSMKLLIQREIVKRVKDFKPGEKIRRSYLKRDILRTSDITKDLVYRITYEGRRIFSPSQILRRIDRVLSDALDEIDGLYIDHDEETRISWVVRDTIGKVKIRDKKGK